MLNRRISFIPEKRPANHGTVLIYCTIAMVVFGGIVSLAVDVGHAKLVKIQLQLAADAAARYAIIGFSTSLTQAQNNAIAAAGNNAADGTAVTLNANTDVEFGTWDANARTFTALAGTGRNAANSIRVTARRTAASGNPVSLAFGTFIGKSTCDVKAQAIAVTSTYGFSIVGISSLKTVNSNGRPVQIDSWNSSAGPYGTFPMSSNGNCSSNGSITLAGGAVIYGSCQPGSGQTISDAGSTISGSTAPLTYTLNYPAPDPGKAATVNDNGNLPSKYFNSSTRDFTTPNGTVLTLPGGTYYVNNVSWSATTFTFTGPVVFYITGTFFTFNNLITTYQNLPKNLKFEVTGAVSVTYDFDQPCYGVLYAPLADVKTWGKADDYGSVVANNLNMNVGWHVDETLTGAGVAGKVELVQ